ncbi:NAD(P)H-dependent oxidoreductase [Shewanella intestini]|uniref:NAD(P)H-dependent oxidoreductase n=1 Tax=Shewanella intestini TaxID=2017544 RepID=A0ABS5I375_9GAMM|nr:MULTISPECIES: NAD(P)H-dependent oxidoreductase [Shewanella]MBR9728454.1 NAD(P)H-dependent oxidoreductase [Shewanella intestini]MRG36273.1 flavodoxin family protein [Shewanella sp. XMDDZSB0408]
MNVLVVYWHPEPQSFNGAMFRCAIESLEAAGHNVKTSDLNEMMFNPVSGRHNFTSEHDGLFFKQQLEEMHATEVGGFSADIEVELEKLQWSDLVIFQFPLWWFGLPAMLKGWVDRVFAMGKVYGSGRFYDDGVFKDKRAMLSTTIGGPKDLYVKGGWNGDLEAILRPIHRGVLEFTGFSVLAPQKVFGPARMTQLERKTQLDDYAARLATIFDEAPIQVGEY